MNRAAVLVSVKLPLLVCTVLLPEKRKEQVFKLPWDEKTIVGSSTHSNHIVHAFRARGLPKAVFLT